MGKLTWIKKRVRMYEAFEWSTYEPLPARRSIIYMAIEDYNWMNQGIKELVQAEVKAALKPKKLVGPIKSVTLSNGITHRTNQGEEP
jgi:hypothetical protein